MTEGGFEIVEGSPESSIILHVPHSSRLIPDQVRRDLLLSDIELEDELNEVTDTLTDQIALHAVKKLPSALPQPWLFINRLSRFVIDPERFPDEREIMNKVGMGAVYLKTTTGKQLRPESFNTSQLLETYFHPYSHALSELVDGALDRTGAALIIDVHSYRANQHQNAVNHGQRRPAMCIGTDEFHTPDWLTQLFRVEFSKTGDCYENEPYAGTYVPLKFYRKDSRVHSIMMETRADTYLDQSLKAHGGLELLSGALASVISGAHARRV